ncbi:hypothetical protein SeLEV6574_g06658 [Synchytrium endobioticum]|uniref:Muskelin N-terminal domain-containing protein n=1 Tax=Synchytrium endobioticum TaxID=286115 RepID=A0A507CMM0_9FUNG|nr:hypothetical protein SeLEV6574_g06658 [Synchytrium endobioticum]
MESDFWRYDVATTKWTRISANTAADGGPDLIYDHQMCVDPDTQILYVFGGRAIGPDPSQTVYSGLYAYCINQDKWRVLRQEGASTDGSVQLRSRIGHSMLLNHITRELYIFAGQRFKDYLADFYVYDIENDVVHEIARDYSKAGGPDGGFTQRATIDIDLGELYVFSGLIREKASGPQGGSAKNSFWVYETSRICTYDKAYQWCTAGSRIENNTHDNLKNRQHSGRPTESLIYLVNYNALVA